MRLRHLVCALALCGLCLSSLPAMAAIDYSFMGAFTNDDDVQTFSFSVGASSSVTLRTWSYAGGTNAAGSVIPRGGFDPILALFDSTGAYINQNDDGGGAVSADAVTGQHYDTYLSATLGPGNYTVAVMQYNNFAIGPNLSNGFSRQGQPNFTWAFSGGANAGNFWDATGNERNANWAFDILNVQQAVQNGDVPEPTALIVWSVLGCTAIGFGWWRKRRAA